MLASSVTNRSIGNGSAMPGPDPSTSSPSPSYFASGIHTGDPNVVLEWHRRGMTMLTCNSDIGMITTGAHQTVRAPLVHSATAARGYDEHEQGERCDA